MKYDWSFLKKMMFAAVAAMGVVVSAGAEEILENGAFEQVENGKARGWALGGCFKVLPGEGHNGNMGLARAPRSGGVMFQVLVSPSRHRLSAIARDIRLKNSANG